MGSYRQRQETHRVREPGRQRRLHYKDMCGAEHDTPGVDTSQMCGTASQAGSAQGKTEDDSREPIKKAGKRL